VVSNDINNQYAATVTVLPFTSSPGKKVYPFEISVPEGTAGLTQDSRIKADQIRTVDKKRLMQYRGILPGKYMEAVQTAIKVHLNMKTP
jgi:mRNA interferase MazF